MGVVRTAPPLFEAELRKRWPDFLRIEWDEQISRWRFFFTSAAGRECSLIYTWDRDPHTGGPPKQDPLTGLRPFRDLDADAQREIIYHGERSALTNRQDGKGDWRKHGKAILEHNDALKKKTRRDQAENYAYALQQVDLRRPWVKVHKPAERGRGKRFGAHMHSPPKFFADVVQVINGIARPVSFGKGFKSNTESSCA